ncbi:PfkB family carbohydrate kinase [Undibacterium arcticum]
MGAGNRSSCPTSLAIVSLDEQGSPTYAFHRESVADRDITADLLIAGLPVPCALLHTGGLTLVPADLDKILTTIGTATSRGTLISIDANLRPMAVKQHANYIAGVKRALQQSHIVKVSDEDLELLGLGSATLEELSAALFAESSVQLIALTRGAAGAALLTRHCQVEMAAPADLDVVDTVGAGDCFHAGLIAYLQRAGKLGSAGALEQLDRDFLQSALQHAVAAASLNIARAGCDPATWEETIQFKKIATPWLMTCCSTRQTEPQKKRLKSRGDAGR